MGEVLDVIHYAVGVSVLDVVRSKFSEFGKTADREQKLLCLSSRIAQCVPPFWFVVKKNLGSGVAFKIAVPTAPSTPIHYTLYLLGATPLAAAPPTPRRRSSPRCSAPPGRPPACRAPCSQRVCTAPVGARAAPRVGSGPE
jgi:hypothetical protein